MTSFNIHQTITDKIIAAIEQGAGTFRMPWVQTKGTPRNATTQKTYRGVNVLSLWIAGMAGSYTTDLWATFEQWKKACASVRNGEKGTLIVFYKQLDLKDDDDDTDRKVLYARASHVFNADQVDGAKITIPEAPLFDTDEAIDKLVADTGAAVHHGGERACYIPSKDEIHLPERARFVGTATSTPRETYYSTLFHELGHWTGHESRLNRTFGRWGEHDYHFEELVAELTAAFLCAETGLTNDVRADHAQYIQGYVKLLKSSDKAIFAAAAAASKAADLIAGRT
ncbi:MAG: ArdC family protein [Bosea sp. (in: a-proteobacteria)]